MNHVKAASGTIRKHDTDVFKNIKKMPGEQRIPSENTISEGYLFRQAETESNARSYPRKLPFAIDQAKGIYIKDVDGNVYYDCFAGAGAIALGHNHDVVQEAIKQVIDSNLPLLTLDITTPVKERFVTELLSCFPEEFARNAKVQFCGPTGSDAVEAAIKLVKIATGRRTMLAFHGGYHGVTNGALSMMGGLKTKSIINGLMPDVYFLPYPYNYRQPVSSLEDNQGEASINYIESVLADDESGIPKPAGIIVESVQGKGGIIPAPNYWMQELRRITKEQSIPLIVDEIQTGLGRTGQMFGFMHSGIIPDVVVLSKAVGGTLPLALVVYNKKLDAWTSGAHAGTFRGNQLAMATGTATIKYIKEKELIKHAAVMGDLFKKKLITVQKTTNCIGDIRGQGLMLGLEIVNNKIKKRGQPERFEKLARQIQFECFCRGLIVETGGRQSSVISLLPPLIIEAEQVNEICTILKDAIIAAEKMLLL